MSLIEIVIRLDGGTCASSSAFEPLSLAGIDRPSELVLGGPDLNGLPEEALTVYFTSHQQHFVKWNDKYGGIDCDCSVKWLISRQNRAVFKSRFVGKPVFCKNFKKNLWQLIEEDFVDCADNEDMPESFCTH